MYFTVVRVANREVDQVLIALKVCRACEGSEVMWQQVSRGVRFLAGLLEEIEGLGPDYALEVALKVALGVGDAKLA